MPIISMVELNSARAWRNQRYGSALEDNVIFQGTCDSELLVIRQHPETKFFSKGKSKVIGIAFPDFIAFHSGYHLQAYAFDCKSTANKKAVSMPANRRHQFEHLKDAAMIGVHAFYLVEWREYDEHEAYAVTRESSWPYRCRRGEGKYAMQGSLRLRKLLIEVARDGDC